jgi:hypothetical protein
MIGGFYIESEIREEMLYVTESDAKACKILAY